MRKIYSLFFCILHPIIMVRYRVRCIGRSNTPDGAALVCANHSSMADPLIAAMALGKKHWLHFMAKIELARIPGLRYICEKGGTFFVNRGISDISAVKTTMRYLSEGEKVMLFPEGTRVSEDDSVAAKNGAVRMAAKTGAPILPVYIPRRKPWPKKTVVVVGEPYYIKAPANKSEAAAYYQQASNELMQKINTLRERIK